MAKWIFKKGVKKINTGTGYVMNRGQTLEGDQWGQYSKYLVKIDKDKKNVLKEIKSIKVDKAVTLKDISSSVDPSRKKVLSFVKTETEKPKAEEIKIEKKEDETEVEVKEKIDVGSAEAETKLDIEDSESKIVLKGEDSVVETEATDEAPDDDAPASEEDKKKDDAKPDEVEIKEDEKLDKPEDASNSDTLSALYGGPVKTDDSKNVVAKKKVSRKKATKRTGTTQRASKLNDGTGVKD